MRLSLAVSLAALIAFNTVGAGAGASAQSGARAWPDLPIRLAPFSTGLGKITSITNAGDGSGRLFVTEKSGHIRIVKDGEVLPDRFLDINRTVTARGNEQGLLGLAFHPNYERNGFFFVAYTGREGAVTISRYRVLAESPDRADPQSGTILIVVPKREGDHNGGMLAFGPDGYLYVGIGDGGAMAEPERNAQRTDTLLGKILRIEVDREQNGKPYAIPPGNPFVNDPDALPEIWAYGLRNPWRFSFDEAGNLIIADVGLWASEEVNVLPAGSDGGVNFGWNVLEGYNCHDQGRADLCAANDFARPVHVYHHDDGCAIVGGAVYRGALNEELRGTYLYGDYCLGRIWGLRETDGAWSASTPLETGLNISTFGEDEAHELYVGDLNGSLYRISAK